MHRIPASALVALALCLAGRSAHLGAEKLTEGVNVDNGAGLSRDARATAGFLVALLRHAWRQPTMPEFVSSLSVVGRDGMARRRYQSAPFAGRMHVKTGLLDDVVAVTGVVHGSSGQRYALAFMVNHAGAHRGGGHKMRDAVLHWASGL